MKKTKQPTNDKPKRTPTFLLELPLQVDSLQAKHLHGHFEAARHLYNALLCEAVKRLHRMRADEAWQQARALPHSEPQARHTAFTALRKAHGFTEYALHLFATRANTSWLATHLDANTAQTLATRAYRAANRVCIGQARRVRFKSQGRGLDSLEGKTNKQGIRLVLQAPKDGKAGWLIWGKDRFSALIDWYDPVVCHGLKHRIKYVRLLRRKASSPRATGADREGYRYYAQLALKSIGLRAPGMFIALLKRTVARTGGTLHEISTHSTKLSQLCHGCGALVKKPLSLRWHECPCGIGPVQRDLYSAFLAAHLNLKTFPLLPRLPGRVRRRACGQQ